MKGAITGCPPVREIIHSQKLVDYLRAQADKTWYNYNVCQNVKYEYTDEVAYMHTLVKNLNGEQ